MHYALSREDNLCVHTCHVWYSDFPRSCNFSERTHAQTGRLRPRAACDSQAAQITVEGNEASIPMTFLQVSTATVVQQAKLWPRMRTDA